ncbi:hypothetical protein SAY87_000762 [Trapa incisa]|uniref:Uncharacterized protein n=1 Tax=Trapa incisa TaxID=236973 RepID=A0AAN7JA14_9MYRT|nr:hypothetical protein SAY87_000762 [Trapa incisa]
MSKPNLDRVLASQQNYCHDLAGSLFPSVSCGPAAIQGLIPLNSGKVPVELDFLKIGELCSRDEQVPHRELPSIYITLWESIEICSKAESTMLHEEECAQNEHPVIFNEMCGRNDTSGIPDMKSRR